MITNISFSKKGKAVNVISTKVVCRRYTPKACFECGEHMHLEERDEIHNYEVLTYECRNGHRREVLMEKEEIQHGKQ